MVKILKRCKRNSPVSLFCTSCFLFLSASISVLKQVGVCFAHEQAGVTGDIHVLGGERSIQITVKIGDPFNLESIRCRSYKAWTHHREQILERLGWQLVTDGQDFATFNIPKLIVAEAAKERREKIPKLERKFWGDRSDFQPCLEAVLHEMEPGWVEKVKTERKEKVRENKHRCLASIQMNTEDYVVSGGILTSYSLDTLGMKKTFCCPLNLLARAATGQNLDAQQEAQYAKFCERVIFIDFSLEISIL